MQISIRKYIMPLFSTSSWGLIFNGGLKHSGVEGKDLSRMYTMVQYG